MPSIPAAICFSILSDDLDLLHTPYPILLGNDDTTIASPRAPRCRHPPITISSTLALGVLNCTTKVREPIWMTVVILPYHLNPSKSHIGRGGQGKKIGIKGVAVLLANRGDVDGGQVVRERIECAVENGWM
ncbi:hypothetical protein L1887_30137 [Cichorium endivia]|nr:hypothetical protein L1887_30137 [Cichorium endivia]